MLSDRTNYLNFESLIRKIFKNAAIVISILLVCGLLAFGISGLFWYFFEDPFVEVAPATNVSAPKPKKWSLKPFVKNETFTKNLPPAASCGKRIIGYYTEWEAPEITSEQLQKLTHVIFLFVAIYEDGSARFWDEHGESRFIEMKKLAERLNTGLKVMIGVGGYMVSPRFGPIVSYPEKRKKLINDVALIMDKNNLDGVELFWIYPSSTNKWYYAKFVKELREKLSEMEQIKNRVDSYILSIVAPKFKIQLKDGYDMDKLIEYVDFIDVLTYDYFSPINAFEKRKFGPNSPLYGGQGRNVDETMKYLVCKTKSTNRINMAISFYGNFWKNVENPIKDKSDDIWKQTESSNGAERWRELKTNGWNLTATSWHEKSKSAYIYNPESKTFLGFENEKSLKEKIKYARERNLGGFVIWAVDQDDDEKTLLNVMTSAQLCNENITDIVNYTC